MIILTYFIIKFQIKYMNLKKRKRKRTLSCDILNHFVHLVLITFVCTIACKHPTMITRKIWNARKSTSCDTTCDTCGIKLWWLVPINFERAKISQNILANYPLCDLAVLELITHNSSYALGQKWCGRLLSHSCIILSFPPPHSTCTWDALNFEQIHACSTRDCRKG